MNTLKSYVVFALTIFTATIAMANTAFACKCGVYVTDVVLPSDGASDVPVNTRIWLSLGTASINYQVLLLSSDESEVSTNRTEISTLNGIVHVLTPSAILLPQEQYEVGKILDGTYYGPIATFTTGNASDNEPPSLPEETNRETISWNYCGSLCVAKGSQVTIQVSGEGLIVVDIGDAQTLNTDDLSGFIATADENGNVVLGGGTGGCGGPWPGERGETLSIRYGSFDLAGNFSGWTEETPITMPKIPATCSCNCTTTQPRDTAPIALLVLGVLLLHWLRRRAG